MPLRGDGGRGGGGDRQRMMAGLAGAVVMLIVELCVFVARSLKADKALETARKVSTVSRTAYPLLVCDLWSHPHPWDERGRLSTSVFNEMASLMNGEQMQVANSFATLFHKYSTVIWDH